MPGSWPHLDVLEHVWVVADLPQLHDGVHQGLGTTFALGRQKRGSAPGLDPRAGLGVQWEKDYRTGHFRGGVACGRVTGSKGLAPVEAQRARSQLWGSTDGQHMGRAGRIGGK